MFSGGISYSLSRAGTICLLPRGALSHRQSGHKSRVLSRRPDLRVRPEPAARGRRGEGVSEVRQPGPGTGMVRARHTRSEFFFAGEPGASGRLRQVKQTDGSYCPGRGDAGHPSTASGDSVSEWMRAIRGRRAPDADRKFVEVPLEERMRPETVAGNVDEKPGRLY